MKLWIALIVAVAMGGASAAPRPPLVLMVSKYDQPGRDLAAMTLGWMCKEAGVEFDVYYAADHREGGLFSAHGSSVIGGHHAARIGRALSSFKTTVVRLGDVRVFDTLIRNGAEKVIDAPPDLLELYSIISKELGLKPVSDATVFGGPHPLPAFYPEVVYRRSLAVPMDVKPDRLKELGIKTVWTVAPANADMSSFKNAGIEVKVAQDLSATDPVLEVAQRWIERSTAVDPLEPLVASYQLPMSIRDGRLMLTYKDRKDGERRRDQMLKLIEGKNQSAAYGRWFGDPQLIPYANLPLAYNVTEPNRNILTVFSHYPQKLPQPAKSWIDLGPSDDQLKTWAKEGKILATWVLHSGELSHDDAVLAFQDWSAMTKVKIGSGVHWQRYHFDPDAVESMHIPVDEGGTLGLVEPVLHSAGAGIIWETSGDPVKIAALMADSRKKMAAVAGERFAPRGVYCFADHGKQDKNAREPGAPEIALYKAVKDAGFDYLVTSILPGDSRILYRDGDFVVLNQAGKWESASPFVRGTPATFAAVEKKYAEAGKPGWLIGAIDSPIHGSPIYVGRPYGGKNPHPRINEFYDYVQNKGATGKVISATPHTIARYARLCADLDKAPPADIKPAAVAPRQGAFVPPHPDLVLLEAEAFSQYGGWLLDQQFMDVMGSPYLLAHGLGRPVAPATTRAVFKAGKYRVLVRTRDWVAPKGPGQFKVTINGKALEQTFGIGGDGTWQWHDGGLLDLAEGEVEVGLKDLTGFDGRVDAILFARDAASVPPNSGAEMAAFRKKALGLPDAPADAGEFDLVVVGGGYAGTCASIAASRLGLRVALIQDRSILGGNASSEIRVGPIGKMNLPPFPRNADILKEILAAPEAQQSTGGFRVRPNDDWTLKLARAEYNLSIFLEHRAVSVEKSGDRIAAVIARSVRTGEDKRFKARLFADCTGDACIGFLAGAHWRMGRESRSEYGESFAPEKADALILGSTQMWTARKGDKPSAFPACPWALNITGESAEISRPKYPPEFRNYAYIGGWNWESGFDKDPISQGEEIRDYNFRAIYGTWDYHKNKGFEKGAFANAQLEWVAHVLGKRESRRLMGDHVLTQQDVADPKTYPDGVVTATWYFDLHFPHPESEKHFPGGAYRSIAYDDPNFKKFMPDVPGVYTPIKPYPIPFRCFYSRNVPNLFMAGRNVSATHIGLAPIRVQNTTGAMGTMIGRAAWLCKTLNVEPRGLYEKHLEELKSLLSDPKPR